ncbi:bifunctional phosphoribosyl-AMP cyclohydrolase/phosphoribosyl-ATP diphosphatase HisIE [Aureisphaera sp. CAU 1614]|uniref:Histidine biosynthesis bifunctional protein HisIE n=1 Tax=Halomarinibacterium sedimenti TaxID=2857106 RepID=A0A9X1FPY1_9FLAO|nr:bifunctional phosphoribosyl-AMP cyclohydrolase/phosphoribosyl-ATP diphosphatase HisIE [Halomarinibacterium sedimenti]MBW2938466.1 bifunctional phosphoribosyl-AMP cyclohydrolase/phosphoribosyl-ATP diphosphatase HisIE [Halomarinibacterium sedimenti]
MNINFEKGNGLVPVIIQQVNTLQVLMLGYMNEEAFQQTRKTGLVTFFSRSKQRLWTKGETSNNKLIVKKIHVDCDKDTILIKVLPTGPTCHKGTMSCFGEARSKGFIYDLEDTITERISNKNENSYTYQLAKKGINKVAQKVGEEAVELIIESKDSNSELFKNEAADLLYHLLLLLKVKETSFEEIESILKSRSK